MELCEREVYMSKISRLFKFLLIYVPVTVLNGIRMIVFENVCIDEILFEISKPKQKSKGISKYTKKKIIRDYLDDCLKKSDN